MVKVKEVCLDPKDPCARWYPNKNEFEQVTVPDLSMSLSHMVATNTVQGVSSKYVDPGFIDDDVAHDQPDYGKMGTMDPVDKEEFVQYFNDFTKFKKDEEEENARTKADAEEKAAAAKAAAAKEVSSGAGTKD